MDQPRPRRAVRRAQRPAEGKPSFSSEVRHELALVVSARPCCQLSELMGIAAAAAVPSRPDRVVLRLTLNAAVRTVMRLARLAGVTGEGGGDPHFQRGPTHIRPTYRVTLEATAGTPGAALLAAPTVPDRACCKRAFLRGAFIVGGSINRGSGGYHLEFQLPSLAAASAVRATLAAMDAGARTRQRRRWSVYLKGSEAISLTLAAMCASQSVLRWEETRILREVRGRANRVANSETANLGRTVETGLRQVGAARSLARSGLLTAQPPALRQVAQARLDNPSASLQQLAQHLRLSRSAVNQRLRRLLAVAAAHGLVD